MSSVTRVGIIGIGWVGSSVAISTLHAGVAQELLIHDVRNETAEGEAMDLAQGAAFYPAASVRSATIDDLRGTAAVVVAAGRGGRTNHAIGLVTAARCRSLLRGERRVLTVSRVQDGALGFRDVAFSLPR